VESIRTLATSRLRAMADVAQTLKIASRDRYRESCQACRGDVLRHTLVEEGGYPIDVVDGRRSTNSRGLGRYEPPAESDIRGFAGYRR